MDVYLDERSIAPAEEAATLGQVIDGARARAAGDGRVIVAIACDGIDISNGDLAARLAERADKYGRVDLQSGTPERLAVDALEQALLVLDDSDRRRSDVVGWLAQGKTSQAKQGLSECFGHWSRIHQAIAQSLALLQLDEHDLPVEGRSLTEVMGEIREQLRQIKEVLEVGDDVLLSDLLAYEFDATVGKWRAVVQVILDRVRGDLGAE